MQGLLYFLLMILVGSMYPKNVPVGSIYLENRDPIFRLNYENMIGGRRLPKFWSPISQKNYPKFWPISHQKLPISYHFPANFCKISRAMHKKSQIFSHPQKLQNLHLKNANFLTKLGKFFFKENEKSVSKIPKIFWEILKNPNFFLKMLNYPKFS